MKRLWSSLKRESLPRRLAEVVIAVLLVAFAASGAFRLFRAPSAKSWVDGLWLTFWAVAALGMLARAIAEFAIHRRRRAYDHRRGLGLCGHCAYDLRGAMSVTCPECGAYHGARPGMRLNRSSLPS